MTNIYNPKELGTTTSYELKDVYITSYQLVPRLAHPGHHGQGATAGWDVRSDGPAV